MKATLAVAFGFLLAACGVLLGVVIASLLTALFLTTRRRLRNRSAQFPTT